MSTQGVGADTDYGLGRVAAGVLASAPAQNVDEERWQAEGGGNVV
jgi:hypothetical protein